MQNLNFNWLDIVIILVLVIGAYTGYRRGLIVTVFNTLGLIAALIVARLFTNPVSSYLIENTKLYEKILEKVTEKIGSIDPMTMAVFRLVNIESGDTAEKLAGTIMGIIVFIGIFIIVRIVLSFLKNTLKAIADKTPVGVIDSLAGMIIGIVMSAAVIFIFFAVAAPFLVVSANGMRLADALSASQIAKCFYQYNPIIPWLNGIISI